MISELVPRQMRKTTPRPDRIKLRKEDGKLFVLYIMELESAREMTG